MKIVPASIEIISTEPYEEMLKRVERAGRVCYKSEGSIEDGSAERFIRNILKRGHESVIEHAGITVKVTCDRGVTHEIVRHRLASYSQESTVTATIPRINLKIRFPASTLPTASPMT